MRPKPVPYTEVPANVGDFLQDVPPLSALHIVGAEPPVIDPRPCCEEHGTMAQGFDEWYCDDCRQMENVLRARIEDGEIAFDGRSGRYFARQGFGRPDIDAEENLILADMKRTGDIEHVMTRSVVFDIRLTETPGR